MTLVDSLERLALFIARGANDDGDLAPAFDSLIERFGSEAVLHVLEKDMKHVCQSASLLNLLGQCYLDQGRRGAARRAFQWALNRDPNFWRAQANLAVVCTIFRAYRSALQHAESVLRNQNSLVDMHLIVVRALIGVGREAEALERLREIRHIASAPLTVTLSLLEILADAANTVDISHLYEVSSLLELGADRAAVVEVFNTLFTRYVSDGGDTSELQASLSLGHSVRATFDSHARIKEAVGQVDIIIPIHNALGDVKTCLAALERIPMPLLRRLILVDDASDIDTAAWLKDWVSTRKFATLVQTTEALGFTGACIWGVKESTAPWFLLLNSDTIPTAGFLENLWAAQFLIPSVACVGPVSNTAYFQSLETDFIINESAYTPSDPLRLPPERVSEFLQHLNRTGLYSTMPLLSGFCLMVRRQAYDEIGGLDREMFPSAYGEVQDLCMRMTQNGWECCVSYTAFVYHAQGRSYQRSTKAKLMEDGYARLFSLHTPFKVLCAEAVSRLDISMQKARSAYQINFSGVLFPEVPRSEIAPSIRLLSFWGSPPCDLSDSKLAIIVGYCPDGTISRDTALIAQSLRRAGFRVLFIANVDEPCTPINSSIYEEFEYVMVRINLGYDFGAWKDVLSVHPDFFEAERLLFVNDSLSVINPSIDDDFVELATCLTRFFSMSDADDPHWHPQSFCFGWTRKGLSDEYVKRFWDRELPTNGRADAINLWELELGRVVGGSLSDADITVLHPSWKVFPYPINLERRTIPTHYFWRRMIKSGFPFVKTYLLRDGGENVDMIDAEKWLELNSHDFYGIMLGVEWSALNRLR